MMRLHWDLEDGDSVQVVTEAGKRWGNCRFPNRCAGVRYLIPHGFGLNYKGEVYGINVNRLTKTPIGIHWAHRCTGMCRAAGEEFLTIRLRLICVHAGVHIRIGASVLGGA
jgi:hypothetical protein